MADKDFFLSPDDAQTLGDINYMRMAKRVRKTFPKTLKNKDGFESIVEVSSLEDRSNFFNGNGNGNGNSFSNSNYNFQSASPESNGISQDSASVESSKISERAADTSMDMFRNMARKINKRR
ncbi:MAG: hypothetical protein Tsb0014_06040 [Pleurocapsa sp.]